MSVISFSQIIHEVIIKERFRYLTIVYYSCAPENTSIDSRFKCHISMIIYTFCLFRFRKITQITKVSGKWFFHWSQTWWNPRRLGVICPDSKKCKGTESHTCLSRWCLWDCDLVNSKATNHEYVNAFTSAHSFVPYFIISYSTKFSFWNLLFFIYLSNLTVTLPRDRDWNLSHTFIVIRN